MELEQTWARVASIWWLFMWRGVLGGVVLGGIIGFVIGFIGTMLGFPRDTLVVGTQFAVVPIGLLWGIAVLRMGLKKKYRDFRVALLPRDSDQTEVFS